MSIEHPAQAADDTENDAAEELPSRRIATGPFAPDPEDQLRDARSFLAEVETPRDENAEVRVPEELQDLNTGIGELDKRIKREEEKETALAAARAGLNAPHEPGETLQELKAAREQLLEDKKHLEFADKHEPVFDELADLSESEREHVAKTGKTKDGRFFHDKDGHRVREDVAKELAQSYIHGGGRLSWGSLRKLGKVVEKILHDVTSAVTGTFKSMFTGSRNNENGDVQSFTE
ncbi:MAG: hypothetical protein AAB767_03890 [Patescibacteria group bacterium]